ncbi:MAG TPA: four helix bundle protein [Segetibacter sp.]|nr:four helix bundle protein [Segetibacter sp.]
MKSYRNLEVFKESKRLAIEIHKMSMTLPKFEMYEEGSQIRRSAKAVTSLVVEDYIRRRYKQDFIKYLVYSQSECDETILHLDFLFETESLKNEMLYNELKTEYDNLGKRINKFVQWVENNLNDFPKPTN